MITPDSPLVQSVMSSNPLDRVFGFSVSYSFERSGVGIDTRELTGGSSRSIDWTNAQKDVVRDTFGYIETIIDLEFVERTFGVGDINFMQVPTLGFNTTGFAATTGFGQSLIVLPTDFIFPLAFWDDNVTVIHEIGHALGLSHPFDGPDRLPGVRQPYDPGTHDVNSELATRMSYLPGYTATYPTLDIYGEPFSFGAVDIAALQLLYGANERTGLGNTIYGARAGELITIWDNGGTDTIAFGVEIENAIGGSGADRLVGNAVANTFTGGKGNDRIDGGHGFDTARYLGDQDSYTLKIGWSFMVSDRRADRDGTDTLINIEALEFSGTAPAFDLTKFGGARELSDAQLDSVVELYIAYFGRAPASTGLNYWATELSKGYTLHQMAASFFVQPETQRTYSELFKADGSLNDVSGFVQAAYVNVLGREARPEGLKYWVDELNDNPAITPSIFVLALINGAKANTPAGNGMTADQQYLATKTDIGIYYAAVKGLFDAGNGANVMSKYDGSFASVQGAKAATDGFYTDALDANSGEFILQLVGIVDDPFAGIIG